MDGPIPMDGRAGPGEKITENIWLCPDGKYRWIYEFSMLKNPVILMTILKIFGAMVIIQILLSFLLALFDGDAADWVRDYLLTPQILIVPGILFGLSLIGYFIVAAMYGWKYVVLFEMNEEGVEHIQMPKQFEKAQALGWLIALAGMAAGSPGTAGAGILSASKSRSSSSFANVRKVIGLRHFHTIKVNELLEKNQVYAAKEDYDFVWSFITARCPKAKIR